MSTDAGIIIAVSVFWLIILFFLTLDNDMNSYRLGYAECKSGLETRYDPKSSLNTKRD